MCFKSHKSLCCICCLYMQALNITYLNNNFWHTLLVNYIFICIHVYIKDKNKLFQTIYSFIVIDITWFDCIFLLLFFIKFLKYYCDCVLLLTASRFISSVPRYIISYYRDDCFSYLIWFQLFSSENCFQKVAGHGQKWPFGGFQLFFIDFSCFIFLHPCY